VTKAEIRIAQTFRPRDWVPLKSAFLRIMSLVDGKAALAHTCINRDLSERRLRAVLVAFDMTIERLLEPSDWQQRTVRAAHIPAEGVWVEPYEEGHFFIWRADLDEEYPITPVTAADRQRYAEGGSEPAARAEESILEQASPAEPPPEPKLAPPTEPEVRTEVAEASSARSPGGDHPVAEPEAAPPPPVDPKTTGTAEVKASDTEAKPKATPADTERLGQLQGSASAISPESPKSLTAEPKVGRPTDRDMILKEADWRLRHGWQEWLPKPESEPTKLRPFARWLRSWLELHGEHRVEKTGEVMKLETIEDHVRQLWNDRKQPE
jgi:hypothetical protein